MAAAAAAMLASLSAPSLLGRPASAAARRSPLSVARRPATMPGGTSSRHRPLQVVAVKKESTMLPLGTRCPDFDLVEPLTGRRVTLADQEGAAALLVAIMCNHCPFVIHLKPAITKLADDYMPKGLAVVGISSNSFETHPQDGPEAMAKDAEEQGYAFPYLYDETQEVAKAFRAACTPEFYLFKKDGRRPFELAYRGQFDDSRPGNNVPVTGKDLREAIERVLSGRPVDFPQKPSIGCNVKWQPGKEPEYF
eukprot:jgi/Chlat1/4058/Chrsp26S04001